MKETFYSNGKLLITAEYVVLDSAEALALPTKFGQNLTVETVSGKSIYWKSIDADGSIWFEEDIPFSAIAEKVQFENQSVKNTLVEILHEAFLLNPNFLKSEGYQVTTQLSFPKLWGLGTSSTLINNFAQWLKIDAFTLLKNSFGGSGYDIACAQNNFPILYRLESGNPIVTPIAFDPKFKDYLYFVYLNKKQSSKNAIASYKKNNSQLETIIPKIDAITKSILETNDLEFFCIQLEAHEELLSAILKLPPVKQTLFPDFIGTVKSLGAWGGDFVLAVSKENPKAYFAAKGFETVIPFSEMIL